MAAIVLTACAVTSEVESDSSAKPSADIKKDSSSAPNESSPDAKSGLMAPCEQAFTLMETYEPGDAPRKEALEIANQAFFVDDSPDVTEAFSNLNNVYVFDDGSSSVDEVRSQLEAVCP